MDANKDYYATLGVLPSAEGVVIRAAYKALAQRYHPDRFEGSKDEALRRMQDINGAYAVLSDPVQRKAYDDARHSNGNSRESYYEEDSDDSPPSNDQLEGEWNTAVGYYPTLIRFERRLSKVAWRLGYAFRVRMLMHREFESASAIAAEMEHDFLESYFGTDPKIIEFAFELIDSGNKNAAKALNEAIRILGVTADGNLIISKIRDDFNLQRPFEGGSKNGSQPPSSRVANDVSIQRSGSSRWIYGKGAIFLFVVACLVGIFVLDGYRKGREATAKAEIAQLAAQQAAQEEARKAREELEAREKAKLDIQRGRELKEAMERSSQPTAVWQNLARLVDGNLYADPNTKSRTGNVVKMWVLLDFKAPMTVRGKTYSSMKRQDEFDCSYESMRTVSASYYSRGMGVDDAFYNSRDVSVWSRVQMGSVAHSLWAIACG